MKSDQVRPVETFNVISEQDIFAEERYVKSRERWDKYTTTLEVAPSPLHVDIELTNICDLKCPFCESLYMKRAKGMMSMDTFRSIVDQCQAIGVDSLKLNLWGESVLNKDLVSMIRYVKENSNLIMQFNTNANRMSPEISSGMVEAGLDRLTISVDGISKETYEKLRYGGNYERVVENIEALLDAKRRLNSSLPHVTLQFMQMKDNIHEEEQFVSYWRNKVDRVSLTNVGITANPEVLDFSVREDKKAGRRTCEQLFQRLSVFWDGTVTVCCNDYEGFLAIGDIENDKLLELWHGSRLSELRKRHKELDFAGLICDKCSNSFIYSKNDD